MAVRATMSENNANTTPPASSVKTACSENRPRKKDADYYAEQTKTFEDSFKENEFLTITEALEAVNTRIVSLLTSESAGKQWKRS